MSANEHARGDTKSHAGAPPHEQLPHPLGGDRERSMRKGAGKEQPTNAPRDPRRHDPHGDVARDPKKRDGGAGPAGGEEQGDRVPAKTEPERGRKEP